MEAGCPSFTEDSYSHLANSGRLSDVLAEIQEEGESPATIADLEDLKDWLNAHKNSPEAKGYGRGYYFAFGTVEGNRSVPYLYRSGGSFCILWSGLWYRWNDGYAALLH